jgi:hypothetical protein
LPRAAAQELRGHLGPADFGEYVMGHHHAAIFGAANSLHAVVDQRRGDGHEGRRLDAGHAERQVKFDRRPFELFVVVVVQKVHAVGFSVRQACLDLPDGLFDGGQGSGRQRQRSPGNPPGPCRPRDPRKRCRRPWRPPRRRSEGCVRAEGGRAEVFDAEPPEYAGQTFEGVGSTIGQDRGTALPTAAKSGRSMLRRAASICSGPSGIRSMFVRSGIARSA